VTDLQEALNREQAHRRSLEDEVSNLRNRVTMRNDEDYQRIEISHKSLVDEKCHLQMILEEEKSNSAQVRLENERLVDDLRFIQEKFSKTEENLPQMVRRYDEKIDELNTDNMRMRELLEREERNKGDLLL
jgi:uncharacterized protein YlxW (UPF0749 family)